MVLPSQYIEVYGRTAHAERRRGFMRRPLQRVLGIMVFESEIRSRPKL